MMKDRDMDILYKKAELKRYKDDPNWFKLALLRACTRDSSGKISHLNFMERNDDKKKPIVTILKYIRAIMPDSINPIDDEIISESEHINSNTCIVLIPNDEGEYIEPISEWKVSESGLASYSIEEIYDYTIGNEMYMMLGYRSIEIPAFGYVTDEILDIWKNNTVPYKQELLSHLGKIKENSERNFGNSFVSTEEITSILKGQKKMVK